MRTLVCALLVAAAFAGCATPTPEPVPDPDPTPPEPLAAMSFETYQLPAIHTGHGLYEPTIDVSPEGVIYVSAHSTGIGLVPAPGYYSVDDGVTWESLALAGPAATPAEQQGAAPLFSDEIFIVAGDDGTAWGVDINLRDYMVTGWCKTGAELCYYNPNAYDHTKVVTQAAQCQPVPLKDRPWNAYSNGTLLLVNNPGGGPAQIGAMRVPPAVPYEVGHVASNIQWNLCASTDGFIPGIPDLRADGFFAVPQMDGGRLKVITGNVADVMAAQEVHVMNVTHRSAPGSQISNYGQAAFDADGRLYVSAMNNDGNDGGFLVALSLDGQNFTSLRVSTEGPVSMIYIDGNRYGPGALVNWGIVDGTNGTDYFFGHLFEENGKLVLKNVHKAVEDGPEASRHVQGAAAGPDGRAYMVMSTVSGNDSAAMAQAAGTKPLHVVVQMEGPRLPVQG
jgi:hypothetical protein